MVTTGVILATISATNSLPAHDSSVQQYMTGVVVLTVALILSGLLGMVQDWTYTKFRSEGGSPWQESMFYIHFLSLPMFFSVLNNISAHLKVLHASPALVLLPHVPVLVPKAYLTLGINVFTQVFCAAGANRLTSRVSSLTVTLVLVVRKAVSLILSIAVFGDEGMDVSQKLRLWGGAILVFAGTVVYSMPTKKFKEKKD
jgi:UDP-xylose/UDP-N-acetylglucosamine transporter B4